MWLIQRVNINKIIGVLDAQINPKGMGKYMNSFNIVGQINGCNVYKVNNCLELAKLVMKEEKGNLFVKTSRSDIRKMCLICLVGGEKEKTDGVHCINFESGFQIGWCICSNSGEVPVECKKVIIDGKEFLLHPKNLGCDRNVFFITEKR